MPSDQVLTTNESTGGKPKSAARYVTTIIRLLMGLMFFVFGLNGFLHFIPEPKGGMPEKAMAFAGALMNTGYMMPLVMGTPPLSTSLRASRRSAGRACFSK